MWIIQATNVSKSFPKRKSKDVIRAIEDISFFIEEGEFVSIIGPSGCGKTTLLKTIGGLITDYTGELKVRTESNEYAIGMVFQTPGLLPWRSVMDNVILPTEIITGFKKGDVMIRAKGLLGMAGLLGFESSYPWELSGGMQQRVSLCRALVYDPRILLMDEPFGALDALTRETLDFELRKIWETTQKTVVLVTHSIPEAVLLSNRVLVMSSRPGRIIRDIPIDLPSKRSKDIPSDERFTGYTVKLRQLLGV